MTLSQSRKFILDKMRGKRVISFYDLVMSTPILHFELLSPERNRAIYMSVLKNRRPNPVFQP
jgi:hypothetical protein